MKTTVEIGTLRELISASGIGIAAIAERLGLNQSTVSLKISGDRPMFLDECAPIAAAVNAGGRIKVNEGDVMELIGRTNLKIRGYLKEN
jgi:DNA transposition AAA+ family ATPase